MPLTVPLPRKVMFAVMVSLVLATKPLLIPVSPVVSDAVTTKAPSGTNGKLNAPSGPVVVGQVGRSGERDGDPAARGCAAGGHHGARDRAVSSQRDVQGEGNGRVGRHHPGGLATQAGRRIQHADDDAASGNVGEGVAAIGAGCRGQRNVRSYGGDLGSRDCLAGGGDDRAVDDTGGGTELDHAEISCSGGHSGDRAGGAVFNCAA